MRSTADPWRGFWDYSPSAWALVAANVLPLIGVLLFGWDTFSVVALYWVENVVIGAINVLKMITCRPDFDEIDWSALSSSKEAASTAAEIKKGGLPAFQRSHHAAKFFLVPFFVVHYGIFCLVHGVFVVAFFGQRDGFAGGHFGLTSGFASLGNIPHFGWAVAGLAGSHLYSFVRNYLGGGEYRRTVLPALMLQPYGRIIVLHLAILFGGFVAMAMGSNLGILVLLTIGKTLFDLALHLRERRRNAASSKAVLPETIFTDVSRPT